ncbi:hypothetical protein CDAR_437651 [Caerostris darwini]|uniref:Uncharacterized protein n=1 Tax=Caerostris darwini TaxID=1538125 RepID=A0AAV4NW03_9ARAC|nr:hypothetical protein CDAR_437651 [Caerostris darwini]
MARGGWAIKVYDFYDKGKKAKAFLFFSLYPPDTRVNRLNSHSKSSSQITCGGLGEEERERRETMGRVIIKSNRATGQSPSQIRHVYHIV